MKFQLWPDDEVRTEKLRIGRVPTLVVRPAYAEPRGVGVLWIHGGGYILGMKEMVYMSRAMDFAEMRGRRSRLMLRLRVRRITRGFRRATPSSVTASRSTRRR